MAETQNVSPDIDFSIEIATVNGSGSLTANQVLLRTLFAMGFPVSGKNHFPSNISGLPTWFQIRASTRGHAARKRDVDAMVCMNPESAEDDVARLRPGTLVVCDASLHLGRLRADLDLVEVPFQSLVSACCPEARLQKLVKNMLYDGVLAHLLGLDMEVLEGAIARQLADKPRAIELNLGAARAAWDWAQTHLTPRMALRPPTPGATTGKLLLDGNTACALGALFAGVTVAAWYPITPSTSLVEALGTHAARIRMEAGTSRPTLAILQMEDELAAAGAVVGAGWAGARSMTATSGPGISLMSEFVGLAYWAEIPCVFFDVQRTGPSTGLPTHTLQGDVELCATCSHGDTLHPCLYPSTLEECFGFSYLAFDLAERLQTPVFVLSDLDLGMQTWMGDRFAYPETPLDRGKVLGADDLAKIQDWGRYKDVDGDGIGHRTLPGTPGGHGAYFTRGTGHDAHGNYTERPEHYLALMDRLLRKLMLGRRLLPTPLQMGTGAPRGLLAFGSSDPAVHEALGHLADRHGRHFDYLRLRSFPFADEVGEWIGRHEVVYVVEQNRDGQMRNLLGRFFPEHALRLRSVRHYDSSTLPADAVVEQVLAQEG